MNRPRLRSSLVVVEQTYRGEQSYIVKDRTEQKYFRFRPLEMLVMQEFDGSNTVADISASLTEQGLPITQAAVEGFERKLKGMGLLERSLSERSVLLMERLRAERHRRIKRTHYEGSLLRMRWSAGDPDEWMNRWMPRLKFLFRPTFLGISVVLFAVYFGVIIAKWPEFTTAISAMYHLSTYTLGTFVLLWCTAMVIIVVHELGHGFTCKYFGGEVHEMGAMLLYFQPAFYCNVNDAWTFPELRARLWVTAAGSWIQLVLAGIAAIVWWAADPGTLISRIAVFAVLIGGVTTIFANANPLIPLDGYYALSDYLEIPNLRKRAFGYLAWLIKRYLLRLEVPQPRSHEHERRIFVIYGILSFLYSATILYLVAGLVFGWMSRTLGAIGVMAFLLLLWAILRGAFRQWAHALVTSIREHRGFWRSRRVWGWIGAGATGVLLLLSVVPWPIRVRGEFVTTAPLELTLTASEGGVVTRVHATEGMRIAAGAPILVMRNPAVEREALTIKRMADSVAMLEAEARAMGRAARHRQLAAARAERDAALAGVQAKLRALTLRAPVAGIVATPRLEELVGRWIEPGEAALWLRGESDSLELRITLEKAGATRVAPGQRVRLMPHTAIGTWLTGRVMSVSTAASGSQSQGLVEARVRMPRVAGLRPGATGKASIVVRRSNMLGALWWAIRKRIRNDILL